jgi:hypothetical protein
MHRPILCALALLFLGVTVNGQTPARFSSHYDGKRYDFFVTEEQLKATPSWADDVDAPPLAPRAALSAARKSLQELIPASDSWGLVRITLMPMWRSWVYLVEFAEPMKTANAPRPSIFTAVVLMNGETVRPKIVEMNTSNKP